MLHRVSARERVHLSPGVQKSRVARHAGKHPGKRGSPKAGTLRLRGKGLPKQLVK